MPNLVKIQPLTYAIVALTVVGLLLALLAFDLHRSYGRELEHAERITGSLAAVLEQHLLATVDKIDLAVSEAQFQYSRHRQGRGLSSAEMNPLLDRLLGRLPGVLSLRLIDQDGNYVFDASGKPGSANIGDRRYFQVQRDDATQGLFAEGPLYSRVVGQWTETFSRGVRDDQGKFLGIVQSSLRSDVLAAVFNTLLLDAGDSVVLINLDRVLVSRLPQTPELIGKPIESAVLADIASRGLRTGSYSEVSPIDGVERVLSFRRVGTLPLYVITGISYDKILQDWRRTAVIYSTIAALLLISAVVLVGRALRRFGDAARQAEEQRKITSEVFASSLEGILVCDAEKRIITVNQAFSDITGYSLEEAVGRNPSFLASGKHDGAFFQEFWEALQAEGRWRGEIWNCRKSGEPFPEWLSVSTLRDAEGNATRYIGVFTDITERKAAENRLHKTIEQLAESNTELERFTYVASHDLQEPLRSITSFSQLLERHLAGKLDEDAKSYIDFIIKGGKRMHALVNDLLVYSRVAAKGTAFTVIDPEASVETALENLRESIDEAGAQIVVHPLPKVMSDGMQLAQLFQNLIGNGVKFRVPGVPPKIVVDGALLGDMVEFTVRDNGIGIEPEFQAQIFVVFRRLHTAEAYPGTGIGLSICKRIVDRHGGRLWVTSTLGGGSTFHFTLPRG